jgi:hypothetical protein
MWPSRFSLHVAYKIKIFLFFFLKLMLQNIDVRVHILMILLSTMVDRHKDFEGRCCLHVQGESKSQEKERFTIYGSLLKASLSL